MTSFNEWENGYLSMDLLRFTTAGSVDDGKSTLIGRLLYDSKAIFEDQLSAIELSSMQRGEEEVNLALLTDGLKAEREQGITIDVAYRYFASPKRKFIIADTPGHTQYTRNMVTGASTADLALILVDARKGVIEQTVRHSYIASLLQIKHIVLIVNKMDLVAFSEEVYSSIITKYKEITKKLNISNFHSIPICAKKGDNVVTLSENMPWYRGKSLFSLLETVEVEKNKFEHFRFPVQYVIRPQSNEFHDFRGYAGQVAGGKLAVGEDVKILPSGLGTKVITIESFGTQLPYAKTQDSVVITLADDVDICRGDMIVPASNSPIVSQEIKCMICWFNERPLNKTARYVLRHNTHEVKCKIQEVVYRMNINTLEKDYQNLAINMNDIAEISLKTTLSLYYDSYSKNRHTGSVVLIDETTNETVAAGMII